MALSKNPKYDLKRNFNRVLQISFIIYLSLLILAFKLFPDVEISKLETKTEEPPIDMVVIPNTKIKTKPPPPKPIIPIEAPTDELLKDIEIEPTDLDVNAVIAKVKPLPTTEEVMPEVIFVVVEKMPKLIGSIASIQKRIAYPEIAQRAGVEGRVFVKAFVDENGKVFKVELIKGIGGGCDEEALKAVKNSLFIPGKQRGKSVKVQVTVPVYFKLQ